MKLKYFRNKNILLILIIILLLTNVNIVRAQTTTSLYVATNGSDSSPGTLSQPWRTIQKAMNSATPGSTVHIRGGTYNERLTLNVSGTAGNYITFQPYGFSGGNCGGYTGIECAGEKVILDYAYLGPVGDTISFLMISGKSYVKIQGLTFQNYSKNGSWTMGLQITNGSSFIEIRHNKFFNLKDLGAFNGCCAFGPFRIYGGSRDITVYGNEIAHTVTLYGETLAINGSNTTRITIENNYIHDTDKTAIDFHGGANNWVVRGNLLEYTSKKRDGSFWYNHQSVALYVDGGSTGVIERNIIRNNSWGIEIMNEPGIPVAHDIHIRNNLLYNNENAIGVGSWYGGAPVPYNLWHYNNTLVNNSIGFAGLPNRATNSFVKNNILYNNGTNVSGSIGTVDYNLYAGRGGSGSDANKVTTDPLFNNPAAGDYSLKSNSPAINAGDPSAATSAVGTTDIIGNSRIAGGRIDMGAYEYGGTASPTPTPTPTPSPTPPPAGGLKGDLNNDRIVNSLDWSLMNSKWFTSDTTADLNNDGIVNSLDFSIMNGNWLRSG